ncbi:MAG: choice-of-anchor I family protein, partial [Bacteroidota bacterium]
DPVLVVNVDGDYKYLGRLVVEFNNNGVLDLSALDDTINGVYPATETQVTSISASPNPDVVALRDAVQGVISAQFSNVVGFTSVYLDGRRSQVRTQETNLGNLTADANLWYANLLNPAADADVDISLKNGGGIRSGIGSAVIPGGSNNPDDTVFLPPANNEMSEGNLRAVLRFDNGLVRLTMTPEELVTLIEHGLALVAPDEASGRFPQVGGMSFSYDPARPPGNRLITLTVDKGDTDENNDIEVLKDGVIVAPNGTSFNMVTLNFLANGGDGYPFDQLSAPNRLNYYFGEGFGDPADFPDGELANDPGNNTTFSDTGGEQDALAEFMFAFHPDNTSAFDVAETPADQDTRIVIGQPNLEITEIFPGQSGTDLTADWFEITNNGDAAWVSGVDPDLYYDDESAEAADADLIQGITDIQRGERVIVVIGNASDANDFTTIWDPVVDLTGIEIGFADGAGLGAGGDAVNIWIGDPNASGVLEANGSYPDTGSNDGQSYDLELAEFSTIGNSSFAVQTLTLGGDSADVPNIASPGNVNNLPELVITEIFPGQSGTDLTADWFEITNIGGGVWDAADNGPLYYDDESADTSTADLVQGISIIGAGERVIVLVTDNANGEITTFTNVWGAVVDLTGLGIGFTDGAGLGSGGDAVNLWIGQPGSMDMPYATGSYPDTENNDGQSYDLELGEFSTTGNSSNAVATTALGGDDADTPNVGSPGNAPGTIELMVTEAFPGQNGADLTVDWFEIRNNGTGTWTSGVDPDLFYDDDSSSAMNAAQIQGINEIGPDEYVVVLITDDFNKDLTDFNTAWSPVIPGFNDLKIGFTDGPGLGTEDGDAVTLWLGDPNSSSPVEMASYPSATSNDGQTYDFELSEFSTAGNASFAVETIALGGAGDVPNIGSPGNIEPITSEIGFDEATLSIAENGTSVTVSVSPNEAPSFEASVDLVLVAGGSATEGTDFTFASPQTLIFPAGSTDTQTIEIPIIDNGNDGADVFFALSLENENKAIIGSVNVASVYILDDDTVVPAGNDGILNMNYLASYTVDPSGTAEITTYDPDSERLFVTNSSTIEVLDFSDPSNIQSITSIELPPNTDGVQSVDVRDGLLAAAVASDPSTDNGIVIFSDIDGNNSVTVEVGSLPDMLTFTPDGTKVVVANEGEPSGDYTIDPEGSVSIIDVTGGLGGIDQSDVVTANFNAFDAQEVALKSAGVRIFGPGASVSQDLEPEYITVSDDSNTAYVALQENNAYAVVDLVNATITDVLPFGLKDHSLPQNSLDASDEPDFIFNAPWPIFGLYMPDAISYYEVNGTGYIVTANEGDARDYNAFAEERKLGDSDYMLDPAVFPNADILAIETNLGDINVTNASGNTDADPEFEEIHVFGGRSFSIFQADNANLVYDSGNDFEVITAADPVYGPIFNASNSNNNLKNRSDNKGPEPEGVIVEEIEGSFYAFVLLER